MYIYIYIYIYTYTHTHIIYTHIYTALFRERGSGGIAVSRLVSWLFRRVQDESEPRCRDSAGISPVNLDASKTTTSHDVAVPQDAGVAQRAEAPTPASPVWAFPRSQLPSSSGDYFQSNDYRLYNVSV